MSCREIQISRNWKRLNCRKEPIESRLPLMPVKPILYHLPFIKSHLIPCSRKCCKNWWEMPILPWVKLPQSRRFMGVPIKPGIKMSRRMDLPSNLQERIPIRILSLLHYKMSTSEMGATSFCPGSHYCANDGMAEVCEEFGFQLSENSKGVWSSGDAALLSQHVWHRGARHVRSQGTRTHLVCNDLFGKTGFSFQGSSTIVARNVLSHAVEHVGEYNQHMNCVILYCLWIKWRQSIEWSREPCHEWMKHASPRLHSYYESIRVSHTGLIYSHFIIIIIYAYILQGHTFQDLVDAAYSMAKPFSVLRCLGLWKPANRNWGYDLMTSGLLRCANNQQGMTSEELQVFVDNVMNKLGIPEWLQGPVTEEEDAWQLYLKETLSKSLDFVSRWNLLLLGVYASLVILTATFRRNKRIFTGSLYRLAWTHGILLLLGHFLLQHIYDSPFATDLRANRMLLRAFPVENEMDIEDDSIPTGPLALPERDDVLVGSRFDARFLGAFDRWLDYHPGNKLFRASVSANAEHYKNYSRLPLVFREEIIQLVKSQTTKGGGRFLSQDYQSGLWSIMSNLEVYEYTQTFLVTESSPMLAELNQEIAYLRADYRFGLNRDTVLARFSLEHLRHLENDLFSTRTVLQSDVSWPLATTTIPPVFTVTSTRVDAATTTNAHSTGDGSTCTGQ